MNLNLPRPDGAQVRALCFTRFTSRDLYGTFGLGAHMSVGIKKRGDWSF
jgi:hypothetical protein